MKDPIAEALKEAVERLNSADLRPIPKAAVKELRRAALDYAATNAKYGTNLTAEQGEAIARLHKAAEVYGVRSSEDWAQDVVTLRAALKWYGAHDETCPAGGPCECGFDALAEDH